MSSFAIMEIIAPKFQSAKPTRLVQISRNVMRMVLALISRFVQKNRVRLLSNLRISKSQLKIRQLKNNPVELLSQLSIRLKKRLKRLNQDFLS
jgi:hypothetical protein